MSVALLVQKEGKSLFQNKNFHTSTSLISFFENNFQTIAKVKLIPQVEAWNTLKHL